MLARNLTPPSSASSATTAGSSTIPQPARFFSPTVSPFACRAPTHPRNMAKPNVPFALLITFCALSYFRQFSLRFTWLRHFTPPHTSATGSPPKPSPPPLPTTIYIRPSHPMSISRSLAVPVTPTCLPQHPTNLRPAHPYVSFLATPRNTKAIGVSSSGRIASSPPDMSFFMNLSFLSPTCLPLQWRPQPWNFFLMTVTSPLLFLEQGLCMQVLLPTLVGHLSRPRHLLRR